MNVEDVTCSCEVCSAKGVITLTMTLATDKPNANKVVWDFSKLELYNEEIAKIPEDERVTHHDYRDPSSGKHYGSGVSYGPKYFTHGIQKYKEASEKAFGKLEHKGFNGYF